METFHKEVTVMTTVGDQPPSGDTRFGRLVEAFESHVPAAPEYSDFEVPEEWHTPANEMELWHEAHLRGLFTLEAAMARAMLGKLLVQNKYLRGGRFAIWPSRERHQFWAALWLALRLVPGRTYSANELEVFVAVGAPPPSRARLLAAATAADADAWSCWPRTAAVLASAAPAASAAALTPCPTPP